MINEFVYQQYVARKQKFGSISCWFLKRCIEKVKCFVCVEFVVYLNVKDDDDNDNDDRDDLKDD